MRRLALLAVAALALALVSAGSAVAQTAPPILPPPPNDCRADYGTGHAQAALEGLACPPKSTKSLKLTAPTASGTVEQFDSTDVNTVPGDAQYIAGYIDGCCQSYGAIRARFPGRTTVGITVFGGNARVFDSEPGNPTPDAAARWARGQIDSTSNKRPVVYTMGAWWSWAQQALAGQGIPHCSSSTQQGCYLLWIASWNYSPGMLAGADCHQWTDRALGLNLDESTCGTWMYTSPAPPPPPPMHYERYAQQSLATPWGSSTRQEFAWVFNYDWARPYYPTAYKQLTINVQEKMRWFANQLAYRIHHSSAATNAANWRYQRFGELTARYKGKRCNPAGWDACVNG